VLRAAGPMAVTSANLSGGANPLTAEDVRIGLGDGPDLVLDGGPSPGGVPSTVVDCVSKPPRLLRAGPIGLAEMQAVVADLEAGDSD